MTGLLIMALTIGLAHFKDFDGAMFTVASLAIHHDVKDCELVIVDNSPDSAEGRELAKRAGRISRQWADVKYVPFRDSVGTSQPRGEIFKQASQPAVLVLDCHVLLYPGSLDRLRQYYRDNPGSLDIVSGPLISDTGKMIATHLEPVWRAQMLGIWSVDDRGRDPAAEPFEIPGQGLGLFSCRRDAWPGFNPHLRGFGGAEMVIQEKFRRQGGAAVCVPGVRWWHRFGRPGGVPYPLLRWDKVRNYVISRQELGLPVDDIYDHFVGDGLMSRPAWNYLLKDPIKHTTPGRA